MGRMTRFALIAVGAVVALVVLVAVCLPLFLNADSFRARIESTLTKSLGRKVTIGKLDLSVWSGGLVATNATVADDPAFSTQPFIQADSVKIGVEIPSPDSEQADPHTGILPGVAQSAIAARRQRHLELLHHRKDIVHRPGCGHQAGLSGSDGGTCDRRKWTVHGGDAAGAWRGGERSRARVRPGKS